MPLFDVFEAMLIFVRQYYNVALYQDGCNAQLPHCVFNYSEYRGSGLIGLEWSGSGGQIHSIR